MFCSSRIIYHHCGDGGLCRVTLMKLIVFVEFCLIPNCFLPTIEVGGQVCSQNNFLPQERQHTRKGNRAVDAFLEFVKTSPGCIGLSTRSLALTPIKRCQIDVKVVPRKALGQFISCSTARQWKDGSFTYFSSQLFLFFRWKEQFEFFLWKNVQNLKSIFIFAANVWFCSSVAFWCKQKGSICATWHLLFSTSPSPSPFPFPILELKISRFRILNSFRPYLTIMKGEEEVGIS